MKTALGWIRWKFVIPVTILVALTLVFLKIYLDPLIERNIEKVAGKINGARVDVDNLKTQILKGRLTIDRVQVADRVDPMTNRVEAGPLAFQMDVGQLFKKRIVIPESSVQEIKFGTKRTTSGVLPKKLKKKIEKKEKENKEPNVAVKLANKYKNQFKLNLDGLKNTVEQKVTLDPKDLEVTRQSQALKEKANTLPIEWKAKVDQSDFDGRIKKVGDDLESLKKTPTKGLEAVLAIPQALEKVKKAKADLDQIKKEASDMKKNFTGEVKTLKREVQDLKKAKKKDMDYLMSKFNLEFAEPNRLVEGLIGKAVLERIQTGLRYVEIARNHLPSKKEKDSLPPKPRAGGMDIEFPRPKDPPRFWLKLSSLSGQIKDVALDGSITSLTSDPPRVGKPMVIKLKGEKDTQKYSANVVADHVGEEKKDSFVLSAKGLKLAKLVSGGVLGNSLLGGGGGAQFVFYAKGEETIGGNLEMSLGGLKFDNATLLSEVGLDSAPKKFEDKIKANFIKNVARSIEKMKEVKIDAQIFGTWRDPDIKLSSNLGPQLAKVIKASVGESVKAQRKKLERQLDQLLKDKQAELQAKLNKELGPDVTKIFGDIDTQIQEKLKDAAGLNLTPTQGEGDPAPVPNLEDLFK